MRYLGNKERILPHIQHLVRSKHLRRGTFADLFCGTGSVSDGFKNHFRILANDFMLYAVILTKARIHYASKPSFATFRKIYGVDPLTYLNCQHYGDSCSSFITDTYSPRGHRMFFTVKNALRIDGMRSKLNDLLNRHLIDKNEFIYLLACLLENVMGVSNTSGTYGAFFKKWERRSQKTLMLKPLTKINCSIASYKHSNHVYNTDTNRLVRHIHGDIAYIDPPYTHMQYASAYNVLETIAKDDQPKIHGKTGNRNDSTMSPYSQRSHALNAFEDLLRQLNFKHVIISYSTQSIIPLPVLVKMTKRFAINHKVEVHYIHFREYRTISRTHNSNTTPLREVLIYFNKDLSIRKMPLDYAGSKNRIMNSLTRTLPAHISNFVDAMGGAFNVGSNVVGTGKTYYNELNPFVYQIVRLLCTCNKKKLLKSVEHLISRFNLNTHNKKSYLRFRACYNKQPLSKRTPVELYVLTLFSFQHMIRFNEHKDYNAPFGDRGLPDTIINRIKTFDTKMPVGGLTCGSFSNIKINNFDKNTLFYFDPPYLTTSAVYNDGKRFKATWSNNDEKHLLRFLDSIDKNGQNFLMSNVLKHHDKKDSILISWLHNRKYHVYAVGNIHGIHPRVEVLVYNY